MQNAQSNHSPYFNSARGVHTLTLRVNGRTMLIPLKKSGMLVQQGEGTTIQNDNVSIISGPAIECSN
jgi:hypothetical protein